MNNHYLPCSAMELLLCISQLLTYPQSYHKNKEYYWLFFFFLNKWKI